MNDSWARLITNELTLPEYEYYHKQVKEENLNNLYDEKGVYLVRSGEINAMKYLKKLLKVFDKNLYLQTSTLGLSIYPNPSQEKTNIAFSLRDSSNISLLIFDKEGLLVKKIVENVMYPQGSYHLEWNNDNGAKQALKTGTYVIKLIINDNHTESIKVIIDK